MLRTASSVTGWLLLLTAAVGLTARFAPVTSHVTLVLAGLSPYLMASAALSAALLLSTHRWWTGTAALVVLAAAGVVELPLFVADGTAAEHTVALQVMTANLREGAADPAALVAIAGDRGVDVLVLQELTPELARMLSDNGIDSGLPYRAVDARPSAAGVAIWSRYPIVASRRVPGYQLGVLSAAIRVPKAADDVVVLAAHLAGPVPQPMDRWRHEIGEMAETMSAATATAGGGPVIVAGDFNATVDMEPFRRLLQGGFRDAAEQSGAGLARSFPADSAVPPLIGIDHVLTFNSSATDTRTIRIPGSDHLGLVTTVHLPSR